MHTIDITAIQTRLEMAQSAHAKGDRILIHFDDNEFYLATVTKANRRRIDIEYDDGDLDTVTLPDREGWIYAKVPNDTTRRAKPLKQRGADKLMESEDDKPSADDTVPLVQPFFKELATLLKKHPDFAALDRNGKIVAKNTPDRRMEFFVRVKMDKDSTLWFRDEHGTRRLKLRPLQKMVKKAMKISKAHKIAVGALKPSPLVVSTGREGQSHRNWIAMGLNFSRHPLQG